MLGQIASCFILAALSARVTCLLMAVYPSKAQNARKSHGPPDTLLRFLELSPVEGSCFPSAGLDGQISLSPAPGCFGCADLGR